MFTSQHTGAPKPLRPLPLDQRVEIFNDMWNRAPSTPLVHAGRAFVKCECRDGADDTLRPHLARGGKSTYISPSPWPFPRRFALLDAVPPVQPASTFAGAGRATAVANTTMAETLAERRRRDEQVRATINQKLVDTGEKERCVREVLRVGLCGPTDGFVACPCWLPGYADSRSYLGPSWYRAAGLMSSKTTAKVQPATSRDALTALSWVLLAWRRGHQEQGIGEDQCGPACERDHATRARYGCRACGVFCLGVDRVACCTHCSTQQLCLTK